MTKENIYSVFAIFLISGCVSISKKEVEYRNFSSEKSNNDSRNINIYLTNPEAKNCVAEYQKIFLTDAVKKYFSVPADAKVDVRIKEKLFNDVMLLTLNTMLSVVSYTIVPIYGIVSYEVLVRVTVGGKSTFYKSTFIDEALISILAVPFMINKDLQGVRRNNLENAIYLAANSPPVKENLLSSMPSDITADCRSTPEDYFRSQKW